MLHWTIMAKMVVVGLIPCSHQMLSDSSKWYNPIIIPRTFLEVPIGTMTLWISFSVKFGLRDLDNS